MGVHFFFFSVQKLIIGYTPKVRPVEHIHGPQGMKKKKHTHTFAKQQYNVSDDSGYIMKPFFQKIFYPKNVTSNLSTRRNEATVSFRSNGGEGGGTGLISLYIVGVCSTAGRVSFGQKLFCWNGLEGRAVLKRR